MSTDAELVSYDLETPEGAEAILAAISEIGRQLERKESRDLATRRLENLAAAIGAPGAVVAGARAFVEWEHPRGPDGRFIEKFGWVRWFDFRTQRWLRGRVMDVGDDGQVTVHRRLNDDEVGVYRFNYDQASKQLYSSPKPKATLDFPDVMGEDNAGWKQVGGQGGSNPGGRFVLDVNDGVQNHRWTEEEFDFLFGGRPSVEIIGLVADQKQFDDDDFSDRLKAKIEETYPEAKDEGGAGVWEAIPGGRRSAGGVIIWDDPEDGLQVAVVNRDHEHHQEPTPERKRADFALQNWVLRRVKAKLLPQNPERKLHPTWRRVLYGLGPDSGMGMGVGGPSGLPSVPDLSLGKETAEGIAQSASQGLETASEIRNAATGALVRLEEIVTTDPKARFFPFEIDADVLGTKDRLRALINHFVQPQVRPGDTFYVKDMSGDYTGPDRVANEVMASRLYELAGVAVPDVYQGNDPSKVGSRIIGGELTDIGEHLDNPEVMAKVRMGFVVDAWLANWDVAGLEFDNIVVDEDGIPYRIDSGGALAYRAMGSPKGDMFGPEVGELVTLGPDSPLRGQATAPEMFDGLTHEEKLEGARRVAAISPQQIRDLALETGIDQHVTETLIARRAFIIDEFLEGVDPFAGQPEEVVPEIVEEPAELPETQVKSDLDLLREQVGDVETFDNPAVEPQPAPEALQPDEFPAALTKEEAWSWSGASQQWISNPNEEGGVTEAELEDRWLNQVEELGRYIDGLVASDGVVSVNMPASDLVGSGVLENPKGIVLMTDSLAVPGGRTDMFVPWGTDADGNAVLVSRISGQQVTPALDWVDSRARARTVDLTVIEEGEFEDELDWIDDLATKAADSQVALEAVRTGYDKLAEAEHLGWKPSDDLGDDPVDLLILDGRTPVTSTRGPNGGIQLHDAATGDSMFVIGFGDLALGGDFTRATVTDPDGLEHDLVLPDMTGQQIVRAKLGMAELEQKSGLVQAAQVTAGFPQETWVKPDPELNQPDVSTDIRGSKPVPTGNLAGPALPDDWDYLAELEAGTYVDTSMPTVLDPTDLGETHPLLPASVPIITSIDLRSATDDLVGQWVMHDVQDYRFTRQPALVDEILRNDDGIVGIAVTHPNGAKGVLEGPGLSRLHIVEPPKEGRNIPALDAEIVLGHNGDIRLGMEVLGSWWHADRNISHRHTYGYMVTAPYTAHGKATIGFRSKARDVRKQVRSEVWFADNYQDIRSVEQPKTPGAKTLESQVKSAVPSANLGSGQPWTTGQAVNKSKSWGMREDDSQGIIVAGVHPDRPDLVYYRDHLTGQVTLENASDLVAHGEPASEFTGQMFRADGELWVVSSVEGNEVTAYSVADGLLQVYGIDEISDVVETSPWVPISQFEGQFLEGSLSSQESKDEWQAVGGMLLADGEIPLPGSQVIDGNSRPWRVLEVRVDSLVLADGGELIERPANEYRVDRAHYGGAVGTIGHIELMTDDGVPIEYEPMKGDVVYVTPDQYHVLTATGELRTFDMEDGWEHPTTNTTEHGAVIQDRLTYPGVHRVGVILGGDTSVALFKDPDGWPVSSHLVGSIADAKAGYLTRDGSSKVQSYRESGLETVVEPSTGTGDTGVDIELPEGATPTPDYQPALVVTEEDIDWFPPPGGERTGPGEARAPVPGITGNGLPAGVLEDTTFPQADNSMSLAEAIQMVWANAGYSKEGKTVRFVQFDQGAIEDFFVQVMPVRDQKTGEEYVELFFRPLEPHADKLFESLIAAPPDESVGQWVVPGWPRDTEDVHPSDLAIGDVIAVRRGPNGQLSSWGGNGTFGTARVISGTRVVGQDSEGYDIVEFDVMLPNGKPATIIQQSNWDYVQRAEWMVTDEAGEQRRLGERRPHQLSEEAFAADWRLVAQHVSSQVRHQSQAFEGDGVKVIDTDAAFNGAQLGTPPNSGVTLARKLGDNTKLWLSLHTPKSKRREEENNFGRSIYIQVPRREFEGGTTEDIARSVSAAMEAVGITPQQQALPTDAALSEWALNTIGQHFGANPDFVPQTGTSDVGPLMPGRKWNQEQVEELLRTEVSPKVGRDVTLEDFEFVVAPDGRLMVAATQKLAEDLSAQSGTVSLRHESDMAWAHTPEERVLMMADRIAGVLGGEKSADNQGPAGRAATGVWAFGQSSDTDMWNGAGNRFYFWTHRDDPPPSAPESGFHILIDDEIFQRFLGNGMSTDDNYGRRTQKEGVAYPILAWTSTQGSPDHNEATVKYGLDSTLIEAIKVPDDLYEGVLREVRRHGITEVGGRPIEEILVPSSQLISMKDRRKTRQVRPNGGFFPGAGNVWTTVQNSKAVPAQKNSAGGPVPGPSELGEMVEPSAEDLAGLEAELVAEVEAGVPG